MSTAFPWEVERAAAAPRAESASVNGGAASVNGGPARSGAVTERTAAGAAAGTRDHQRGKSVSGSQSARALSGCEIPPINGRISMCHVSSQTVKSASAEDELIPREFAMRPFRVAMF
jgi:hypothetical protein